MAWHHGDGWAGGCRCSMLLHVKCMWLLDFRPMLSKYWKCQSLGGAWPAWGLWEHWEHWSTAMQPVAPASHVVSIHCAALKSHPASQVLGCERPEPAPDSSGSTGPASTSRALFFFFFFFLNQTRGSPIHAAKNLARRSAPPCRGLDWFSRHPRPCPPVDAHVPRSSARVHHFSSRPTPSTTHHHRCPACSSSDPHSRLLFPPSPSRLGRRVIHGATS